MPNFAIMQGSATDAVVFNIIMAESLEDAELIVKNAGLGNFCIEYSQDPETNPPKMGSRWDGENFISDEQPEGTENANL